MTRKKTRVTAAFLANLLVIVFAVLAALPGISSFLSVPAEEKVFVFTEPALSSAPEEIRIDNQVLAVSDVLFDEPETGGLPGSLVSIGLDSEKTYAEDAAKREYLEEKERERLEAIEREKRKYAYSLAYLAAITLDSDNLYSVSYRPDDEEYAMLCWVIQHESGPVAFQEGVMVCEAIFNRVQSKKFPNTLTEVLTAPNQFNGLAGFYGAENYEPSETVKYYSDYIAGVTGYDETWIEYAEQFAIQEMPDTGSEADGS